MLHVGLTGGLASGKSHIGRTLEQLGCLVIRMDDLGHEVLTPGKPGYWKVLEAFRGEVSILASDGTLDRRALGAYVFADPPRLERLNAIIHPEVRAREQELVEAFEKVQPRGIAVTEAAILIETGRFRQYDRLIVAVCSDEQQVERAMRRDGLAREQVLDRMRRQMPLAEKRKYAHFVIDTSGTEEQTQSQTKAVFDILRGLEP